ncbi:MAG: hypothetical protein NVSMB1_09110 [Polyangiales bacterium]
MPIVLRIVRYDGAIGGVDAHVVWACGQTGCAPAPGLDGSGEESEGSYKAQVMMVHGHPSERPQKP